MIWGTGAWVVITLLFSMALPWAVLSLIMSFGLLLIVGSGMRGHDIEQVITEDLRKPIVCVGILILIVVPVFSGIITWTSDVANAETFNSFIEETEDDLFTNPIPDNMVRLVTSEYAQFVARQYFDQIGSNIEVADAHITTRNGRLVWVNIIISTNVLSENFIKGLIVVDANDPAQVEVITDVQISVGEGLFWDKNIQFGNYLEDMSNSYEYAYPTWDPIDSLVYVQTRTNLGFDFVERPLGPKVYCQNGTIRTYATIEETPDWITQAYGEEYLERQISRWGGYRRGEGFDLFASGFLWFIAPSNERISITEDTRYIINPDNNRVEALVAVHPSASTSLTLSGIMRATKDKVYYHRFGNGSLVSGESAVNEVIKVFPDPTSGTYFGSMPLIYPVRINSTYTRYAWYCPIYWWTSSYDSDSDDYYISDIRLHALGIADAQAEEISFISVKGTLSGEDLVQTVREGYVQAVEDALGVEPEVEDIITLTANVLNVTSYVEEGATHIVLRTDNATYEWVEGVRAWMDIGDWYELLTIEVGDSFTTTIEVVEGVNRIVEFTKN